MDRTPHHLPQKTAKQLAATGGASVTGSGVSGNTPGEKGSVFDHHIESKNLSLLVDDILPSGSLLVVASSIMGIGASEHPRQVRRGKAGEIVVTWIVTIPAAALAGAAIFLLISTLLD